MSRTPVGPGTRVTLSFSLALSNGEEVDKSAHATFDVGDGSLLPGFEKAMFGMTEGEAASLQIPAEQGFGEPREENRQNMKPQNFAGMDLHEGLVVSFSDADGNELPGVVTSFDAQYVVVDFNHPLAGRDLTFSVELHKVEQVSNEIARG